MRAEHYIMKTATLSTNVFRAKRSFPLRSVEEQIVLMGNALLTKGTGVTGSLAELLRQPSSQTLLSLHLDSADGELVHIGAPNSIEQHTTRPTEREPIASPDSGNDKRFLLSMTPTKWHVHASFLSGSYTWHVTVSLDITSPEGPPLRAGLFKIADYFTSQCRFLLGNYISEVTALCASSSSAFLRSAPEQELLVKIASFSPQVQSVMLLGKKGDILCHSGTTVPSQELGLALAALFFQTKEALHKQGTSSCHCCTVCDQEYTILITWIREVDICFVVSACGPQALIVARFLKTVGADACTVRLDTTGYLCGIAAQSNSSPLRLPTSWFSRALPVPQGILAGIDGSPLFHIPECQALYRADESTISWFKNRTEPLQFGLHPCPTCEP